MPFWDWGLGSVSKVSKVLAPQASGLEFGSLGTHRVKAGHSGMHL